MGLFFCLFHLFTQAERVKQSQTCQKLTAQSSELGLEILANYSNKLRGPNGEKQTLAIIPCYSKRSLHFHFLLKAFIYKDKLISHQEVKGKSPFPFFLRDPRWIHTSVLAELFSD